jgi:hypothetical protein
MQQNPNPQSDDDAHLRTKSRRSRPYTIEARTLDIQKNEWRKWYVYGRYRTPDERNKALDCLSRKCDLHVGARKIHWIEYRVGPTED